MKSMKFYLVVILMLAATLTKANSSGNAYRVQDASDVIGRTFGDVNFRLGPLQVIPSMSQASLRGAFLDPSLLVSSETNSLNTLSFNCSGLQCPLSIKVVMTNFATLLTSDICVPALLNMVSSASLSVSQSPLAFTPSSFDSKTSATFSCGQSPSQFTIALSASAESNTSFPLTLAQGGESLAFFAARGVPLSLTATVNGTAMTADRLHVVNIADAFSGRAAAAFALSAPIFLSDAQRMASLFSSIFAGASSGVPALDARLTFLPANLSAAVVSISSYMAVSPDSNLVDYLQRTLRDGGCDMYASGSALFSVDCQAEVDFEGPLEGGSLVAIAQAALEQAGGELKARFPSLLSIEIPPLVSDEGTKFRVMGFRVASFRVRVLNLTADLVTQDAAARISFNASFRQDQLFSACSFVIDWRANQTSLVLTLPPPVAAIVGSSSAIFDDGILSLGVVDATSLVVALTFTAGQVPEWAATRASALTNRFDLLARGTFGDVAEVLALSARGLSSSSPVADVFAILDKTLQQYATPSSIPFLRFSLSNPTSFLLTLVVDSLQTLRIVPELSPWESYIATNRIQPPLSFRSELSCTQRGELFSSFKVVGDCFVDGWAVPVVDNLEVGVAKNVTGAIRIDLPNVLSFNLDLPVRFDSGADVTYTISSWFNSTALEPLVEVVLATPSPQFRRPFVSSSSSHAFNARASPSLITDTLSNGLVSAFPSLLASTLNVPIVPMAASIPSIPELTSFGPLPSAIAPYLNTYADVAQLLVADFCPGRTLPPYFNLSINAGATRTCPTAVTAPATVDDAVDAINAALRQCGAASLVSASVTTRNESSLCATFALAPTFVGAVLKFSSVAPPADLSLTASIEAKQSPIFGCWADAAAALTILFPTAPPSIGSIRYDLVAASDVQDLVPPELSDFYPSTLRFASIDFAFSTTSTGLVVGAASSLATSDGSASLGAIHCEFMTDVGSVASGGIGAVFGAPSTVETLVISSDFDGDSSANSTLVEGAPNNTLTLTFAFETRLKNTSFTSVTLTSTISLTPGHLLADALIAELPLQLPHPLDAMVAAALSPCSDISPIAQLEIRFFRRILADVAFIPTALAVVASTIPSFSPSANSPTATRILVRRPRFDVALSLTSFGSCGGDGSVGAASVRFDNMSAEATLSIVATSRLVLQPVATFVGSASSTQALNATTIHLVVNSSFSGQPAFQSLSFDAVAAPAVRFSTAFALDVTSQADLVRVANFTSSASLRADGDVAAVDAFNGLLSVPASAPCSWLRAAADSMTALLASDPFPLPFTSLRGGEVMDGLIASPIRDSSQSVCTPLPSLLIDMFCNVLASRFGQPVCHRVVVNASALVVDLAIVPLSKAIHAAVSLDIADWFKDSTLPIAVSSAEDLLLHAEVKFALRLVVVFKPSLRFYVAPDDTYVSGLLSASLSDDFIASIGPLSLRFANVAVNINANARAYITDRGPSITVSGEASFVAAAVLPAPPPCSLSVSLPDLASPSAHVSASCDFAELVASALEKASFFEFLRNPSALLSQWARGLGGILNALFGRGSALWRLSLPFVQRKVETMLTADLTALFGPSVTKVIITDINALIAHVALDGRISPTDIEQIAIDAFTAALCRGLSPLGLSPCPPSPRATSPELTWPLSFGRKYSTPLLNISFALGAHGLAELDVACEAKFEITWALQFALVFNKSHGISLRFDAQPIFSASAVASLPSACQLMGRIGFIGAEVLADAQDLLALRLALTRGATWILEVDASAGLSGIARIGLAGPLFKSVPGDTFVALPHWRASIAFAWAWQVGHALPAPSLQITDGTLCVGSLLARMAASVARELSKVTAPLDPIIGPNSFLRRPIGGTKILFGRDLCVLEIAQRFCGSDCNFRIADFLLFLGRLVDDAELFERVAQLDAEGCGVMRAIDDFIANFEDPFVTPRITRPALDPPLIFAPPYDDEAKAKVSAYFSSVLVGRFGVRFDFLADIPGTIVALIVGRNAPLVGVVFPDLVVTAMMQWDIPVWSPPPIAVTVGLGAQIQMRVGEVALTTQGLCAAIKAKSLKPLLTALAIRTVDAHGAALWPLQAALRLSGGVEVSLFIVRGGADVFIELDGFARIVDVHGDGLVSFADLWWIARHNPFDAMETRLALSAGFELYLKGCYWFFGTHCFTLAHKSWTFPLWSHTSGATIGRLISDGRVNLAMLAFASPDNPILSIGADVSDTAAAYVSLFPTGDFIQAAPVLARVTTPVSGQIGFDGTATAPFIYDLWRVSQAIAVPPTQYVDVRFWQADYRDANVFAVSRSHVTTDIAPGAALSQCAALRLMDGLPLSQVDVSGTPCALDIASHPSSNVTLRGALSDFAGPISLSGAIGTLSLNFPANFSVSSTQIDAAADAVLSLETGAAVNLRIAVAGPSGRQVFVRSNGAGRSLAVVGGSGDDLFLVPSFQDLDGITSFFGGAGIDSLHVTLPPGARSVATPSAITSSIGSTACALTFTAVERRRVDIVGVGGGLSALVLVQPEDGALMDVWSIGAGAGSVIETVVTGCDGEADVRVTLKNDGDHVVRLGSNGVISNFRCAVRVVGGDAPAQTDTVVIEAWAEGRALVWDFSGGRIVASVDGGGGSDWFTLFLDGIERLEVKFGEGGSAVEFRSGAVSTETLLSFPAMALNAVRIVSNSRAIFVNGSFDLSIGPEPPSHQQTSPPRPFAQTAAPIIVAPSKPSTVRIDGAVGSLAPAQRYVVSAWGVADADSPLPSPPSSWMRSLMAASGLPQDVVPAQVNYVGPVQLVFATGAANDNLTCDGCAAAISAALADGADVLMWRPALQAPPARVDVGVGPDVVTFLTPSPSLDLDLGADEVEDVVLVLYDPTSGVVPSVHGDVVAPVGPQPSDALALRNLRVQDRLFIRRQPVAKPIRAAAAAPAPTVINITTPGSIVQYDADTAIRFVVVAMAEESSIVLEGRLDPPPPDWSVEIALQTYDRASYVAAYAAVDAGVQMRVNISAGAARVSAYLHNAPPPSPLPGVALIGALRIACESIQMFEMEAIGDVDVTVDGTPCDSAAVLKLTKASTASFSSLRSAIVLRGGIIDISSVAFEGGGGIFAIGEETAITFRLTNTLFVSGGCFNSSLSARINSPPPWIALQWSALGGGALPAITCGANVDGVRVVTTTAPEVVIGAPISSGALVSSAENSLINVTAPSAITAATFSNDGMQTNHLNVTVAAGSILTYAAPFASGVVLAINCNKEMPQPPFLLFKNPASSDSVEWSAAGCAGRVEAAPAAGAPLPSIRSEGASAVQALLCVGLDGLNVGRQIQVLERSLSITAPFEFGARFAGPLAAGVDVRAGAVNVTIDRSVAPSASCPHLKIRNSAQVILSAPVASSLLVPNASASFDASHTALTFLDDFSDFCLSPPVQCSPAAWVDSSVRGPAACRTAAEVDVCRAAAVVRVVSRHAVRCAVDGGGDVWNLAFSPVSTDWPSAPVPQWSGIFAWVWWVVEVVVAVGGWVRFRAILSPSWFSFLASAAASKVSMGGWPLIARGVVQGAQAAAFQLLTFCAETPLFVISIAFGALCALSLFIWTLRGTIRNDAHLAPAVALFLLLPVVVSQSKSFESAPAILALVLGLLVLPLVAKSPLSVKPSGRLEADVPARNHAVSLLVALVCSGVVSAVSRTDVVISTTAMLAILLIAVVANTIAFEFTRFPIARAGFRSNKGERVGVASRYAILTCTLRCVCSLCGCAFLFAVHFVPNVEAISTLWFLWIPPPTIECVVFLLRQRNARGTQLDPLIEAKSDS